MAQQQGHPFTIAYADLHAAKLAALQRDTEVAARLATTTHADAQQFGFPQLRHQASCIKGWTDAVTGDPHGGAARIAAGLEALEGTGSMAGASLHMLLLVDALQRAGDDAGARVAADKAIVFVDATGERVHERALRGAVAELDST
jgi:hypothetical protein